MGPSGAAEALFRDARNSTLAVVFAGGNVAGQYTYGPFGNTATSFTGNGVNPCWFSGRDVVMNGAAPHESVQLPRPRI